MGEKPKAACRRPGREHQQFQGWRLCSRWTLRCEPAGCCAAVLQESQVWDAGSAGQVGGASNKPECLLSAPLVSKQNLSFWFGPELGARQEVPVQMIMLPLSCLVGLANLLLDGILLHLPFSTEVVPVTLHTVWQGSHPHWLRARHCGGLGAAVPLQLWLWL